MYCQILALGLLILYKQGRAVYLVTYGLCVLIYYNMLILNYLHLAALRLCVDLFKRSYKETIMQDYTNY